MQEKCYIAIDLKSFYASVECVERGLDPLSVNLVVADESRTEKTICLAVTPSLKAYGISGRSRLFEVVERVREVNIRRRAHAPGRTLRGASADARELERDPSLALDYIIARPRMAVYMRVSTEIYQIYLRYVAPEDIHVYSVDEVFMDVTNYLRGTEPRAFAGRILQDVLRETGITATAGIGPNLYLCKVAMDIVAKHIPADENGARISQISEMSYRELLWEHRPLTDFWRVGRGYARKLEANGLFTMGDVARCSLHNEALLYRLFGVNAELLIDHAWGWEPCTIADIKAYRPSSNSLSVGQVLQGPYDFNKTGIIIREMTDSLTLDLLDKGLVTDQMVLTIGYDVESLSDPVRREAYRGPVTVDHYGRRVPKHAHGSINLGCATSSGKIIMDAVLTLYNRITDRKLLVRRICVVANHVRPEETQDAEESLEEQLDIFGDCETRRKQREAERAVLARERRRQAAVLSIQKKYGKNALIRGTSLEDGATGISRNRQIGGHRA